MGPGIIFRGEAWQPPDEPGGRGIPALCPLLACLLGTQGDPLLLVQVALRIGVHALCGERFRLLYMAWVLSCPMETMRGISKVATTEAVRHRLLRVSATVQAAIAAELDALLPEPSRQVVRAMLAGKPPLLGEGEVAMLRAQVQAAIERIAAGQ